MTREEAIKVLNEYGTLFPSDKIEAIDIAIEALQTPPISQRSMYQLGYIQGQEDALQTDIVRCKECGHWQPHPQHGYDYDDDVFHDYCGLLVPDDDYYAVRRDASDFCSYGARRADE